MNPIAFSIPVPFLNRSLDFTWYGISIVIGVLVAAYYAAYMAKRRGENPDNVWDMFIYILIFGVIGARVWYIVTSSLGGNRYYLDNPIEMLNIRAGGTNIFGAIFFGILTIFIYCAIKRLNPLRYLDFIGPSVLLGQGLARWGNFVNQELYGPPTTLPWGIPIDALHRIAAYQDLTVYPLSTRFHPTFLYETIFDLIAFGVLFYLFTRRPNWWKIGSMFGAYLIAHGTGRFFIEFFRPDQPRIIGTPISFSRLLATCFVLVGIALIVSGQRRPAEPPATSEPEPANGSSDDAPAN